MSESSEQKLVVQWFRLQYPGEIIFANLNGAWLSGKNRFALANKYKAEGLLLGVSDLFIASAKQGYHGFFIEMKDKGKKSSSLSDAQKDFLADVDYLGYKAIWCAGFNQARKEISNYME